MINLMSFKQGTQCKPINKLTELTQQEKQYLYKIGVDMKADLKKAFENPSQLKSNTHTLYLKDSKELYEILSPQRLDLLRFITQALNFRQNEREWLENQKTKDETDLLIDDFSELNINE